MKIVEKPWGREVWIAHTDKYALKIIEINKGNRSSLQYHNYKTEHIYVDTGRLRMEEEINGEIKVSEYGPGDVIENLPKKKHRIEAISNVRVIEVSTPELEDVIRVEDDYGR